MYVERHYVRLNTYLSLATLSMPGSPRRSKTQDNSVKDDTLHSLKKI